MIIIRLTDKICIFERFNEAILFKSALFQTFKQTNSTFFENEKNKIQLYNGPL